MIDVKVKGRFSAKVTTHTGIVVHAMGEFVRGKPAWDYLTELGLHAHAFVTPSGVVVYQTEEKRHGAHARGHNSMLGVELLVPGQYDTIGQLWDTLEGPVSPFSVAQLAATEELITEWRLRHSIPPTRVFRHSDLDTKKSDPGRWAPGSWFPRAPTSVR